jgi:hypothetical protein
MFCTSFADMPTRRTLPRSTGGRTGFSTRYRPASRRCCDRPIRSSCLEPAAAAERQLVDEIRLHRVRDVPFGAGVPDGRPKSPAPDGIRTGRLADLVRVRRIALTVHCSRDGAHQSATTYSIQAERAKGAAEPPLQGNWMAGPPSSWSSVRSGGSILSGSVFSIIRLVAIPSSRRPTRSDHTDLRLPACL